MTRRAKALAILKLYGFRTPLKKAFLFMWVILIFSVFEMKTENVKYLINSYKSNSLHINLNNIFWMEAAFSRIKQK